MGILIIIKHEGTDVELKESSFKVDEIVTLYASLHFFSQPHEFTLLKSIQISLTVVPFN